jgi:glycine N-acyltransferase
MNNEVSFISYLGSHSSWDKVIENLVANNLGKVKHTQCILYMALEITKKSVPSLMDANNLSPNSGKPKSM